MRGIVLDKQFPRAARLHVLRHEMDGMVIKSLVVLPEGKCDPRNRHRSIATRTCWRTPSPSSTRRRPTGCCGWPRCSMTSASRAAGDHRGGVSFHHHEVIGARMTRTRMEALATRPLTCTVVRRSSCICASTPTGWVDRQGLRRYVRDAGPHLDHSTSSPAARHDAQHGQGAGAGPAHGRARGPHRRAAARRRSWRAAPRPRREPDHGAARGSGRGRPSARPWTS